MRDNVDALQENIRNRNVHADAHRVVELYTRHVKVQYQLDEV
jgi:hypothetical protein